MKNKFLKKCGQGCVLYIPQQKTCQLMPNLAGAINEDDFCSQYRSTLERCEICGIGLLKTIIVNDENKQVHHYCQNCLQNLDLYNPVM